MQGLSGLVQGPIVSLLSFNFNLPSLLEVDSWKVNSDSSPVEVRRDRRELASPFTPWLV